MVCRENQQFLALPGTGGFRIIFSPDTKILPLEVTPSGHLAFECGDYEALQRRRPSPRDLRLFGHLRTNSEELSDWGDAIVVDYTRGDFGDDALCCGPVSKMIHDINPTPDIGYDLMTDRTRFSFEAPDGRIEPDWTVHQQVVHARRQQYEEEQREARLLEEQPEEEQPVDQHHPQDNAEQQQDPNDAPIHETLRGSLVFICDVCRQPIRINEQHFSFEHADFAGNRTKRFHERCVHQFAPGLQPLLVQRVRPNEDGIVQHPERFGNPISEETMDEVWYMMEQIEVRHLQNVLAREDDSDGDDSEAGDDRRVQTQDGGLRHYLRCFLLGLVIYFLIVYMKRINWSSVMPDFAQDVIGLSYKNEPILRYAVNLWTMRTPMMDATLPNLHLMMGTLLW